MDIIGVPHMGVKASLSSERLIVWHTQVTCISQWCANLCTGKLAKHYILTLSFHKELKSRIKLF